MCVNLLALSALATDATAVVRHPSRVHRQHCQGNNRTLSRDVRVPRSSSAQRRPASTASPKPRTLTVGTGNLSRLSNTARLATPTNSHIFSLPTAAKKRRASGILPAAPTLEPLTGRHSVVSPSAPKPRVSPTRIPKPTDNYFNGTTATPGALASRDTPLRATRPPGFDPPRHMDFSRARCPSPLSYTPRPPAVLTIRRPLV